ncbi:MAG: hypothetical protein JKX76_00755 [Colwellia sp.]|nr:hypothetical protein [Colwellia sp.]
MNLVKIHTVIKFHFNKNGSDLLAKIPSIIRPAKPDCNGVAGENGDQLYYKNGQLHRSSLEGSGSPKEIPS